MTTYSVAPVNMSTYRYSLPSSHQDTIPIPNSYVADAYLITLRAATKLHAEALPFAFPIDATMNFLARQQKLRVYWGDPYLVQQGTESGEFKSSLDKNKESATSIVSEAEYNQQVHSYQQALEIQSAVGTAHIEQSYIELGNSLKQLKRTDEAGHSWEKAVEHDPKNPFALANLAVSVYTPQGRHAEAEAALITAVGSPRAHPSMRALLEADLERTRELRKTSTTEQASAS